ncbi:hypothetical protein B0H14DRAFT_3904527 [Mycena olivaceomarginata]|nr:hypothetical protein B0H14DRAFT_3904527 [Mycena olivaceomarginata]
MYPSSPHMYSRLGPWDRCARPGSLPRPRGPRRPFVSGFDSIERRAALMCRNPIFADIFSVLTPPHDSDSDQLTSACTPPLSSPPFLSAATAALLLYDPNGHHAPSNAAFLSLAPTIAACHAHTHHVRQRPQPPPPPYTSAPTSCSRYGIECIQTRLCPRPPCPSLPPTAFLKAYVSRRPVQDARTDRRKATTSFLGELGALGTGGDAIHPCRARNLRLYAARARLLGVALTGPLRVRPQYHGTFPRGCPHGCRLRQGMRHLGLGLGGPSESGNGNKAATECTTARTFVKANASPVAIRCSAQCAMIFHGS